MARPRFFRSRAFLFCGDLDYESWTFLLYRILRKDAKEQSRKGV